MKMHGGPASTVACERLCHEHPSFAVLRKPFHYDCRAMSDLVLTSGLAPRLSRPDRHVEVWQAEP